MKVNLDYSVVYFIENESSEEERQLAEKPSNEKGEGKLVNAAIYYSEEWYLPIGAYYCRECLLMKRMYDQTYTISAEIEARCLNSGQLTFPYRGLFTVDKQSQPGPRQ